LDSSALVKLVQREAESRALFARLDGSSDGFVTSTLATVEVTRAVRAAGPDALELVRRHFARIDQVNIDETVIESAASLAPGVHLRSSDAIHLATALMIGSELRSIVTYDARMASVARSIGLAVESPE
jgi:predicted nucleic acid-binding protein